MAEGGGNLNEGLGGDTWEPPSRSQGFNQHPSTNTDLSIKADGNKAVDEVWTTNKVHIQKTGSDGTFSFDLEDNVHFKQFLFKHKKRDLLDAHGWKYSECDGIRKVLISADNTFEVVKTIVQKWVAKYQTSLKEKKLELSSSSTKDSLQRSLSCLIPTIERRYGEADVFYDKAKDCLYIVGFQQVVDEVFHKVKADMRNDDLLTMECPIESESHGMMLRSLNFLEKLKQDFPDVEGYLHDCNTKVTYIGKRDEVEECKRRIAIFFSTLHTEPLEMTSLQKELLSKPETGRYINILLRTDNISCVLNVQKQGKLLLIGQQNDFKKARHKIKENIVEKVFIVQMYPRVKQMSFGEVGLSQTEMERVVTKKTDDEVRVAANRDVMQRIIQWIRLKDPEQTGLGRSQQHSVDVQKHQPSQSSKTDEVHLEVSELDMCLWNALGIVDEFKQCTAGNGEILIEASKSDVQKISENIKRMLSQIKKNKEVCPLHEECAVLLKHQETKDYIAKELQKKKQRCFWKLRADGFTIDIYAQNKNEAVKARESIPAMISVISLRAEFNQVKKVLQEEACKNVLQKYHGKAKVLSLTSDEVPLVATADASEEILTVMRQCDKCINTEKTVCIEMPEGACEYLENQSTFTISLKEKYGVHLEPLENRAKLRLIGPEKNLPIVQTTLEKSVADIVNKSLRMKCLPEVLEDENEKKKFEMVNSCYLSKKKERVIVKPCPSHTWVIKNSPYLMLVSENIAETNVYAVVCPVDTNLKPIGAGQTIMNYGGMSLEDDLWQNGTPSPSTFNSKPDFQTYFSGETGNLHCSSVIYTEFPAQNARASGMSSSKSVVSSKIKKALDVAESKEVFSLAIPLDLSDVTALPICMQAVAESLCNYVGTFKHLREIYLYCPDGELENARQIFTKANQYHLQMQKSVDFSLLEKDREGGRRKSRIQLEIFEGSLTDQKVDILVNTTNTKLDLDCGFVSKTMLLKAGQSIQKECNDHYKDGINIGDITWTSAGNFSDVKRIFHVVLPPWRPTGNFSLMVLELLITKCLMEADKMKMQSIAFPVLGTGKLMYPQHLVAKTMCDTVNKYGSNRKTNIKTVKFAIFEKDVLQVFKIYEEYRSFGCSETLEDDPPYNVIEARIPTPVTSVQIQVLPFHGCWWRVHALVEFVTIGQVHQDPQYEKLRHSSCTKEWITKDSQYYLRIRTLCDTDDKFTKGIKAALEITSEERITSMGFVVVPLQDPFSKKELTCKDQAKMIKRAVLEVKEYNKYLQEIKILVKSTEDFNCFLACKESKIESQEHGHFAFLKKLSLFSADTSKCPWKIVRYMKKSDSGFKVTVVADKRDIENVLEKFCSETNNQDDTRSLRGNQTFTGDGKVQGATGGHHDNQTYTGDGRVQGATGGHHGNQTYTGDGQVQGATGGHHGNQTYTGDGRVQGATGGHHGNQTYTGDGRVQGATGGHHGNQTYTGDGRVQGATGGHHGNQTYTGDGRVQGATGGHHGNQTYTGDGRVQGATSGHHGNQTYTGDGRVQGATSGHYGNHENNGQKGDMDKTGVNTQARHSPVQQPMQKEGKQVFSVQDNDVFETIEAVVNEGILKASQWETVVEKHGDVNKDGQIVCKDLSSLQKFDDELQSNLQNSIRVDDTSDHFSSPPDDFEHVSDINMVMPEENFLALQFFCCRDGSMDQQAVHYRDGMLQVSCNEKSDKKAIQLCIESKLKHIEIMNKDDVSFSPAEEPKVKGTIKQIHKSVDGVFCYQLEKDEHSMVHLMAQSYSQLQTAKHKISLGLGRIKQTETRRNRRFDNTPLQQNKGDGTSTDRHRFSQSFTASQSSWKTQSTAGYGSVSPKDFTTQEGLLVRVYPASILHLDVDCIVNAANGDLQHGGGVACVISNAAGYDFERESRDYIARYGPLSVGEVCTTTAGNLKYKGVIHSVGPRWYDYGQDQKRTCLDHLTTAVKNSLEEADIQNYKSIAIPAISSGIFGVPKELCTQQYYRAVEEYSKSRRSRSTLTEVHFIDKDTQMCELIQTTFTKCFAGNAGSSSYGAGTGGGSNFSSSVVSLRNTTPVLQRSSSVSADEDGSSVDPASPSFIDNHKNFERSPSRGQCFEYQINNNLTVHIVHGNIVDVEADAIVSPENVQCDSTGSIAREIARVAGQAYVENDQSELRLTNRKPKLTEVLDTLAGRSHFKYVLHVVAPKWNDTAVEDQFKYWTDLEQSYNNIISTIDKKHLPITSVALPIFGTGTIAGHPAPIISISKMIAKICKSCAEKTTLRKTLYFCNNDSVAAKTLRDVFEKKFNKVNEGAEDVKKGQTPPGTTGRDRGAGLEVTEDCCICMDTMTEPKKLSCGHMFCRECIDQQFKYKPACPQCGAVHGKITGDQPPGTMTMTTTKSYWRGGSLPGYEGCGIINITYSFPSGKQGPDHPTPGKYYQGITRPAFLPDNKKGRLVARLLRIAFDRKLVFTIGRSRTTGHDGVVTWNDIHHKTRSDGGPQAFGYPDPTYLDRVLDELKAKGVTEESLNDP
ncbi:uncharacterized protein LOC110451630 [Mizuhopecten yessoensis]|uniref:uncharacterized protein LOC110451630 n=1 Tax=Mizuhopecten yessoensis TaxID=6573 RepID=UPI000B45E68D|nr:uncharacterized protein LOC110451630 [Mizuhopecten yessoensis]